MEVERLFPLASRLVEEFCPFEELPSSERFDPSRPIVIGCPELVEPMPRFEEELDEFAELIGLATGLEEVELDDFEFEFEAGR